MKVALLHPSLNRRELRAEAARRGGEVAAEIEDTASGAKFTRSGLDQLMKLVRRHSIKAVLCSEAGSPRPYPLPHLVQTITEFDGRGIATAWIRTRRTLRGD